jgi:hypothetical protein
MAAKVLTTGSTVKCPHGFGIAFTSGAATRVGGAQVVRSDDLVSATLACTAQQKCVSIAGSVASAVLNDTGAPVVLVTGISTNIGPCTIVDAGHDLLETE